MNTSRCSLCDWRSDAAVPVPHYLQLVGHMESHDGGCTHARARLRDALSVWCADCGEILSGWGAELRCA